MKMTFGDLEFNASTLLPPTNADTYLENDDTIHVITTLEATHP